MGYVSAAMFWGLVVLMVGGVGLGFGWFGVWMDWGLDGLGWVTGVV